MTIRQCNSVIKVILQHHVGYNVADRTDQLGVISKDFSVRGSRHIQLVVDVDDEENRTKDGSLWYTTEY